MRALLIGATGLIGKYCLNELLNSTYYNEVEIWVRKSTGISNSKLKERIINFDEMNKIEDIKADRVFCCLGTTIKIAKSKEAFKKVDYGYVSDIVKVAAKNRSSKFLVISSIGANKDSNNFYLKTKGEMEEIVLKSDIPSAYILRPSLLEGPRAEKRFGEGAGKIFMGIFGFLFIGKIKKYRSIKAVTVAKAMVKLADSEKIGKFIIESDEIEKIASE
jgi:uncharacterized protein YbjT (DUF2867 family)